MASAWARTRARERIVALGAAGLDDRDLRRQVLAVLREVIDFGAYVWLLTDPVTTVGAAPLAEVPCFGLTTREHELLGLLAAGGDTRAMARQMSLSEHTIQDHLKSIFAKTGARDRVTVLSRALGTRREANMSAENSG
jgi:DNA-binding CsgD family transcriptional regulator